MAENENPQNNEPSIDDLRAAMRGEPLPEPAAEQTATPKQETAEAVQKETPQATAAEAPAQPEDQKEAQATSEEQAQEQPQTETKQEPQPKPRPPRDERRWSRLTHDRDAETARANAAEAELARLRSAQPPPGASEKPAEAAPAAPTRPKPVPRNIEDLPWEQQEVARQQNAEDLANWVADQRVAAAVAQMKREQQEAEQKRQADSVKEGWRQRAVPFLKENEDFGEAATLVGNAFIGRPGASAIIMKSEVGPEMVERLHGSPEELEAIANSTDPLFVAYRLGVIEAEIKAEKKAKTAPPHPRVVKDKPLPNPPKSVGGSGSPAEVPLGEEKGEGHMDAFKAKLRAQGATW